MKWFWLGALLFCFGWFGYGAAIRLYRLWAERRVDEQALILAFCMEVVGWRAWEEWRGGGDSPRGQENRRRS